MGLDPVHASGVAWLEERIRRWPESWGDDLHVLIYGDFRAPESNLEFPTLGITVSSERQKETIIKAALTVLKATVRVREKSVSGLLDATKRINLLLGVRTLHTWGNDACGWWSWVTHGTYSGVMHKFEGDIGASAVAVLNLPTQVRQKIEAALFWIREPRALLQESYRADIIRVYSSYWNAFECLVDAVHMVRPAPALSKKEKDKKLRGSSRNEKEGLLQKTSKIASAASLIRASELRPGTHSMCASVPKERITFLSASDYPTRRNDCMTFETQ